MHSATFLEAQTALTDLFLGELARLDAEPMINFNNTKQFDTLLRHLESTLPAAVFVSVPSENILHILMTLAVRAPASNWSHDSLHALAGDATEYMRMVNLDYDSCLYKTTLQRRSTVILRHYVAVLHGHKPSHPLAKSALAQHVSSVLGTCHKGTTQFKFPPAKRTQPRIDQFTKRQKKPAKRPRGQGTIDLFLPGAVEVISDSEDSDCGVDLQPGPQIDMDTYPLEAPHKAVTSLSDLSTNTSGLGETATLFKQMPHLLGANGDSSDSGNGQGGDSNEENTSRRKKTRFDTPGWQRLQVFDDHLVLKKLLATFTYDIWSLLKWSFWCADTSSQYQKFLFNSGKTHVHEIYQTTADFLEVFFGFCHAELVDRVAEHRIGASTIAQLLKGLGPRKEWHERVAAYIFSGLGVPVYDKPTLLYNRELVLTQNDSVAQNSRCKTTCDNDANKDSMRLRAKLLYLMVHYDVALQDLAFATLEPLLRHLVRRLAPLPLPYVREFFASLQQELTLAHSAHTLDSACPGMLHVLNDDLAFGVLCHVTATKFGVPLFHGPSFVGQMCTLLVDTRLYNSVVHDHTFRSVEDFVARWEKVIFLVEWLFSRALETPGLHDGTGGGNMTPQQILEMARTADTLAARGYEEYLEGLYEDSDILPETYFTLTRDQITHWMGRFSTSFGLLAQFKLGIHMGNE